MLLVSRLRTLHLFLNPKGFPITATGFFGKIMLPHCFCNFVENQLGLFLWVYFYIVSVPLFHYFTLKPVNSFPPQMFLVPSELLFQCWSSEQVVQWVTSSTGSIGRTPGTFAALILT